jgi:tetratricopeptide (TPR) repeat protein
VQQFRDERDAALESYRQALGLYQAVGDRLGEANTLKAIGDVQQFRDERDAALESYRQALGLYQAVGARLGEANTQASLSRLHLLNRDVVLAEDCLTMAVNIRKDIGDVYGQGADYGNFAIVLLEFGEKKKAKEYALRARSVFENVDEPHLLSSVDQLIAACEEL